MNGSFLCARKIMYLYQSINYLFLGSVIVSIVQFNCCVCTMGQKYFWRRILVITAPAISWDMTSTHWNCWNTKNSWRISKWIRIDEDNLHSHISRSMHLAQNLVEKKNESTKKCDKKPNLFLDLQLSNLPNPKIQFFIGGGVWVYSRPSI